jgi:hypothetical protein
MVAYPRQGHEMMSDAHMRSFAAQCGVSRRGICDTMKTAVTQVKKGKGRVVTARFAVMRAHDRLTCERWNALPVSGRARL